jgi:hypothetical protein
MDTRRFIAGDLADAVAEAPGTRPPRRGRPAGVGDAKGRPVLVLVHVDTTDGVRLVTYHQFLGPGDASVDAHRVVRRGGTIAGAYQGRVKDGPDRLVGGELEPYGGAYPPD